MNTKKIIFSIFSLFIGLILYSFTLPDEISSAIKAGNATLVSKHFAESVDLKILNQEDIYSKAQAELLLKDFFTKNGVKSFSIVHNGSKNNAEYAIGKLETNKVKYRVYFLLKKTGDKILIHQFRIEPENE